MFTLPIFTPRFKSIIFFNQIINKIKLVLQKNAKFLRAGGSASRPPKQPPPPLRIPGYAPDTLYWYSWLKAYKQPILPARKSRKTNTKKTRRTEIVKHNAKKFCLGFRTGSSYTLEAMHLND